ncbi:hypothetical protein BH23PLA1_BH23PLA1_40770 [soil metagenome]
MRGRRPEKRTIAQRDQDALHSVAHRGSLVRLQVCLVREVEVLFRHALSGL